MSEGAVFYSVLPGDISAYHKQLQNQKKSFPADLQNGYKIQNNRV